MNICLSSVQCCKCLVRFFWFFVFPSFLTQFRVHIQSSFLGSFVYGASWFCSWRLFVFHNAYYSVFVGFLFINQLACNM
uniref:Uncharacterized protein n=1 Tax=Physcomitrium patens TaxID=3218 RepID=A0A7I4EU03_PHYPA